MKPYYQDNHLTIYNGHVLNVLRGLEPELVQCVVTSPPYWGLRDYGLEPQIWDGQEGCEHKWGEEKIITNTVPKDHNGANAFADTRGTESQRKAITLNASQSQFCQTCGAWRGSLGLEPTPELYVKHITDVFRKVRRVLKKDGTLWLNLGDSYAGSWQNYGGGDRGAGKQRPIIKGSQAQNPVWEGMKGYRPAATYPQEGLKPKDLVGIPWRVAFALQADGWWLRSDIIWSKCLSGGSIVYAKTKKGEMPMTVREMSRLKPETVNLWCGEKWVQVQEIEEVFPDETIEIRFRNGQSVGCTLEHKWPVKGKGKTKGRALIVGDVIESCILPEPCKPDEPQAFPDWIGEVIGLYLAEGSRSGETIQFSLHAKETEYVDLLQSFAAWFGGSLHVHIYGNSCHANIEGKLCVAAIETYVAGRDAKRKHLKVRAWRRSNLFLKYLLTGYLNGDGTKQDETFYKLGFTANEALARDLRTICARLDKSMRLRWSWVIESKTKKKHKAMLGDIKARDRRRTEDWEIVGIQPSKGRSFYHIAIDDPHTFSLASGLLTFNSNPMPESVKDRPTKSHEYIFLLTKSAKYYWDQDAVREPPQRVVSVNWKDLDLKKYSCDERLEKQGSYKDWRKYCPTGEVTSRNIRSVWTIATEPTPEAHFATFPKRIPEICIKAGSRVGDTVLDPFSGSGKTGIVAKALGRKAILIELNSDYCEMPLKKVAQEIIEF